MGQSSESALRDSEINLFKFAGIEEDDMTFADVNINKELKAMAKRNPNGFPFRLDWELRDVDNNYIHEV